MIERSSFLIVLESTFKIYQNSFKADVYSNEERKLKSRLSFICIIHLREEEKYQAVKLNKLQVGVEIKDISRILIGNSCVCVCVFFKLIYVLGEIWWRVLEGNMSKRYTMLLMQRKQEYIHIHRTGKNIRQAEKDIYSYW